MSKTSPTDDANPGVEADEDPIERDYPDGLDPNDLPDGIDTVYVANGRSSGRRYHVDPECGKLDDHIGSRRAEIGADWYPPCKYCVTGEHPLSGDDYDDGGEREDANFGLAQDLELRAATGEFDADDD